MILHNGIQSGKRLVKLQRDLKDCSIFQMQVLHVMTFVIEQVEHTIRPHSEGLVQYLPSLWEVAADHNMLKCAIINTLVILVKVNLFFVFRCPFFNFSLHSSLF